LSYEGDAGQRVSAPDKAARTGTAVEDKLRGGKIVEGLTVAPLPSGVWYLSSVEEGSMSRRGIEDRL